MITEKEKSIYNSYLYASRKAKNKPVRLRQNFDGLESKDEVALKKLNLLLSKYNHINLKEEIHEYLNKSIPIENLKGKLLE